MIAGVDLAGDVGRSLREGFFMFWETLWPLILGFTLSGAVQAFVPRERLERTMGDHRPKAVARASGWGMVSSSCSYAATAMGKSLFRKGADFTTAMIFMVASTNLVLELGIVLIVLLGWQFAAAEFIGGPIMITLLALTGSFVIGRGVAARARAHLDRDRTEDHEHQEHQLALEAQPWSHKLRSRAAWSDAASYTVADLTMLRRELLIGYVLAGFLAVLVPVRAWNDVFLHGHGVLTTIENVVVGPLIAIVAFVCSIGNVPLAAALWHGGISFGGVIAFVFADLITLPLLLIYRKYYGTGIALRLLAWFWTVMAVAGFLVEELFSGLGAVPHDRSQTMVESHFAWNYTTFLNLAFLLLAAYLYWLYRNRARFGGGAGYAIDPVCGMQVQIANAPASRVHDGTRHSFCSDHCAEKFDREASRL